MPQSHSCYELVFYASGYGDTNINGENYRYEPFDLAIIPPHVSHDEKADETTEVYCCLFHVEGIDLESKFIRNNPIISKKIYNLLNMLKDEFFSKDNYFEEYINNLLQLMIVLILRYISKDQQVDKQEQAIKLIEYSKKLIKEKQTLSHHIIAENLGYSYDHFRHLFKDIVGITPKQYQLESRTIKAKELLLTTEMPISQIAQKCGFNSNVRFSTFFVSKIGITPYKYRKLSLENKEKELINLNQS